MLHHSTACLAAVICHCAGYIPRWPFKFGSSFKRECDECLDEFGTMQYQKEQDTARMMSVKRQQQPVTDESHVVEHFNYLQSTNSRLSCISIGYILEWLIKLQHQSQQTSNQT